ncbi:hypothetical protein [Corynebacterium pygosceleis]|uniref:phage tail tube protein n=1 Tax=Corynebacterium pygosceleis TaxID=2800406 RepID=UPI0020066C57|nr:hypothetical protein [Corynebacterium pygosceleis]MCK7676359.1 hypothetical protein [Corynebacterium pygosceleis]
MADARKRKNVLVGAPDIKASGGLQLGKPAPETTNHPTDATAEVSSDLGLKAAGYVGEDGISKTVDRTTEKIKDWNGDTVLVITSEHSVKLKLTFMESANADVLKFVAGENNVTEASGKIKIIDNADDLPHRCLNADIRGNAESKIRVFAPDAQVTNVGDVQYVRKDVIKYEVEIECFADSEGNKLYSFIDRAEE